MSFLTRRPDAAPARVLVASGRRIDLTAAANSDRKAKRAPWQDDAWAYRDSIGEIRYAMGFLKYSCARIRLTVAVATADGEEPTPIEEADGIPPAAVQAAQDALARLSGGTFQYADLLAKYAENLEVPGECNLVGRLVDGAEEWGIYSADELKEEQGRYKIVASPTDRKGEILDPATAYVARLWTPHPRWSQQADSPMRALLETCEELQLVGGMIRRASRSRLAGAGIFGMPSEIDFSSTQDPGDVDGDPFQAELQRAMLASIQDETDPASLVPIVVRAAAEHIDKMKWIVPPGVVDPGLIARQDKALGRLGTGLDVPPEIIIGMADVNHWTAWQVDDSTFRNHVEPLVIRMVDGLTAGYLRNVLLEYGVDPLIAGRVIIWYDASALVVKSNRAEDAKAGHKELVLSDRTLVEALGFNPDNDMPDEDELMRRLALTRGAMDGSITEALLRQLLLANLDNVRHLPQGQITVHPGQDAQDAERDNPSPSEAAPAALPAADPADSAPADDSGDGGGDDTTPGPDGQAATASAAPENAPGPVLRAYPRDSRRLTSIDRGLRDQLTAGMDAAVRRTVERASNRIRTQANKDAQARAVVASVKPRQAAAALGRAVVAALGVDDGTLLDGAWTDLVEQWAHWIGPAQAEAVATAGRIAGLDPSDPAAATALSQMTTQLQTNGEEAIAWLTAALDRLALDLLYDPDQTADSEPPDLGEEPGLRGRLTSMARGAVALSGGLPATFAGLTDTGLPAEPGAQIPGLATGDVIDGFLRGNGVEVIAFEWVYGISIRHFQPHRDLDGVTFAQFGDPVLANPIDWPATTLAPGDHRGCHCDAAPIYGDGLNSADALATVGAATYDPSYLNVLRSIAQDDLAAGRTETSAVQTVAEADRVAAARPSGRK